jgi:enoyl-CoA hydratase/carnithine racemase
MLLYDLADNGVLSITLNRPEFHNAINAQMRIELRRVWRRAKRDPNVRVLILTGAGERAFTSGADRERMDDAAHEFEIDLDAEEDDVMRRTPPGEVPGSPGYESDLESTICPKSCGLFKPVVTAVNGMACGAALYMLGESDIIIAAEGASFFDPHITFGMVAGYESMHMLQRLPIGEVIRMQLLGAHERMSAQRAHQLGLVSAVLPPAELLPEARRIADIIASLSPGAVQGTLRSIWAAQDLPRSLAFAMAPHFLAMARPSDWNAGQQQFNAGQRIDWRLR